MVSVGISKLGLTDLILVHPGVNINGGYYHDMLLSPDARRVRRFLHLLTKRRTVHRARDTVRFLEQSIPAFIPSDLWPPNNIECKIWGDIQQQVHQPQLHSIDELKKRLLDVWHGMDQSVINDANHAIDEWRERLQACVCGCKTYISSNCCKLDISIICRTV